MNHRLRKIQIQNSGISVFICDICGLHSEIPFATARFSRDKTAHMKLAQNQVWKQGDEYIRIVQLERLAVKYKVVKNLLTGEGAHHDASKKEFCRLIKGATLLTQDEVKAIWLQLGAAPVPEDAS